MNRLIEMYKGKIEGMDVTLYNYDTEVLCILDSGIEMGLYEQYKTYTMSDKYFVVVTLSKMGKDILESKGGNCE